MNNTIIYLLGFPGTGKYTIAKEICAQTGAKLLDNHLINNPLFSLIEKDRIAPLPERIWDNVAQIWDAVLDTMIHISPAHYSFVLTNALTDEGEIDRSWFNRVQNGAVERGATFIPVRLKCSIEENERRIVQPNRAERLKEIDPTSPKRNAENHTVLTTDHPHLFNLDVTNLTAEKAAQTILNHARNLS